MYSKNSVQAKLAVDVMGGDNDPHAAIDGILKIHSESPKIEFHLFGDIDKITPLIENHSSLLKATKIVDTKLSINASDKPSLALRKSKGSSMRLAIEAVKNNQCDAIISSGNTGALMAISRSVLKTLPQISRPAIIAIMPSITKNPVALVDAGANAECNTQDLLNFAIMGDAFAKIAFNSKNPKIALLNIGTEDIKGTELIKNTMKQMQQLSNDLNIYGYVEGDAITEGKVDVIVTDGFTGNIALKTVEGTAKFCMHYLKEAFNNSFLSKLGYLLAMMSIKKVFKQIDKRNYNGAMFIGLKGIVVKSHGGADSIAFYNALKRTIDLVDNNITKKITQELNFLNQVNPNDTK